MKLIEFHVLEIGQGGVGFGWFGFGRTGQDIGRCLGEEIESAGYFDVARVEIRVKRCNTSYHAEFSEGDEGGR